MVRGDRYTGTAQVHRYTGTAQEAGREDRESCKTGSESPIVLAVWTSRDSTDLGFRELGSSISFLS